MRDATVIVIAAGRGGRPGESRLDLLKDNAGVVRDLALRFRSFTGTVIVVTNPVDVLTHQFAVASGLPNRARSRHGHDAGYRAAQRRAEPEA